MSFSGRQRTDFYLGRTRRLTQLRKGDIININVPFEENTRDYYNGYKPEDIRQKPFVDRFGQSFKERMVIVMGRDGKDLLYLPLTSKTGDIHDESFQYQLKDNSMTPRNSRNKKSYVEVESVRALRVSFDRELPYTGRITREDLENIIHQIANTTLQFDSKRDQRGYIPDSMKETFEQELKHRGYRKKDESEERNVWVKDGTKQTISRTKYGMVHYHRSMSRKQVHAIVSEREGIQLPPLPTLAYEEHVNEKPHQWEHRQATQPKDTRNEQTKKGGYRKKQSHHRAKEVPNKSQTTKNKDEQHRREVENKSTKASDTLTNFSDTIQNLSKETSSKDTLTT